MLVNLTVQKHSVEITNDIMTRGKISFLIWLINEVLDSLVCDIVCECIDNGFWILFRSYELQREFPG